MTHGTSSCRVLMEHIAEEGECDEPDEYKVLVVLAGEGSGPRACPAPDRPLGWVAFFIQFLVIFPRIKTALLWRHYWIHSHFHCLLSVLVAFIRSLHAPGRLARSEFFLVASRGSGAVPLLLLLLRSCLRDGGRLLLRAPIPWGRGGALILRGQSLACFSGRASRSGFPGSHP